MCFSGAVRFMARHPAGYRLETIQSQFCERSQVRSNRRLRWAAIPLGIAISIILAGCTQAQLQGWLPGDPETTNHTGRIIGLWVTSWIVLLAVGVVTWALIIWAAVVYRRRKGQTGLPVQLRYNMPIEIFYTIVPLILVLGFFAFTARDQAVIEEPTKNPDVKIEVFGKRWAWDPCPLQPLPFHKTLNPFSLALAAHHKWGNQLHASRGLDEFFYTHLTLAVCFQALPWRAGGWKW